jgi:phosphoglycerate dehydrogenase-like enzyme
LALPFSPLTRNLLSDRQFQAMREKSILINIARGGIVDTEALKRALSAKPSMRACLDVLPCEPLSGEDELWNFPNLFITPHVAWCSPLFRPRAAMIWLNNLARMRDGIPLMHLANQEDVHC